MAIKKDAVCSIAGLIGAAVAAFFGGWNTALATLLIFMGIDYLSGMVVAGVFHASKKSESGTLESRAGWKGLCRKGMVLLIVLVGHRLDLVIGSSYIRDAVCIAFIVNETLSIIENAGLMGIKIPEPIIRAIDILQKKGEQHDDQTGDSDK